MRHDEFKLVVFLHLLARYCSVSSSAAPLLRKLLSSKGKPSLFSRVAGPAESGACGPKPLFLFSKSIFREIPQSLSSTWTAAEGGKPQTPLYIRAAGRPDHWPYVDAVRDASHSRGEW